MAGAERRRRRARRLRGNITVLTVEVLPDGRMDRANAAKFIGRSPQTLRIWSVHGKGPPAYTVGGRAYYYFADLEAYVAAELVAGT
jgi:hypothetical protein